MERRALLQTLVALVTGPMLTRRLHATTKIDTNIGRLDKTDAEWKALLEPARYRVLFEEATERPFSSPLNDEKHAGTFVCAACFLPLFESRYKFDSGTGWPSFTQSIAGHTANKRDFQLVLPRTEYHCVRCEGHQGHVFKDGPPPRHERWCNNGLALLFVPKDDALPTLRT